MAGIIGVAATTLLHSLFLAVAIWGGRASLRHPDLPDAVGAGANRGKPDGESAERRIVVRILSDVGADPTPAAPMDAILEETLRLPTKIEITGPDPIPLPPLILAEDGVAADSTDAELMAREKMVGIYESQIRARIERAWILPAEYENEDSLTCRALIRQDRDGRIDEVELPYDECDGSPALRQSLINAIFTASPLPAPPHPGVFVDSFTLVLNSEAVRRHLDSGQAAAAPGGATPKLR